MAVNQDQKLTQKEKIVLMHLQKGHTNQQIACELHISCNTVKTHLEHIYRKLNVQNRTQAAMKGVRRNINGQ